MVLRGVSKETSAVEGCALTGLGEDVGLLASEGQTQSLCRTWSLSG